MVFSEQLVALLISIAGLALIYYVCYSVMGMPKRVSIVIAMAFTTLTYSFLLKNPQIIFDTQQKIALAVIAAIIGFAYLIRRMI